MDNNRIKYSECIEIYKIEKSFINSLNESGLINIVTEQGIEYVECEELEYLEQFVRWHVDLDINIEGIEALYHLLNRFNTLHEEFTQLKNELAFYKKNL